MFRRWFLGAALALAATPLLAQTATPKAQPPAPARATPANTNRYVPAIMHERMMTITGCLQHGQAWTLTNATLADQQEPATYSLTGIGDARLALFTGKRIEATGALPMAAAPAAPGAKPGAAARSLPIFEATAVKEATGDCS